MELFGVYSAGGVGPLLIGLNADLGEWLCQILGICA